MNEVAKRSPANKFARLARLADIRLGKPNNKRRWGTIVEAAKNANVRKLLKRSRSDDSMSSENGQDHIRQRRRKPSSFYVEEATQTAPLMRNIRWFSEDGRSHMTSSQSSSAVTLPLDPVPFPNQHKGIRSFVSKVRSKAFSKSSLSFDYSIEEQEDSVEVNAERMNMNGHVNTTSDSEAEDKATAEMIDKDEVHFYSKYSTEDETTVLRRNCSSDSPNLERCSISSSSTIACSNLSYVTGEHIPKYPWKARTSSAEHRIKSFSSQSTSDENFTSSSVRNDTSDLNTLHKVANKAFQNKEKLNQTIEPYLSDIEQITTNGSNGWF